MKLQDIKPGDVIVADGGFTCLDEGEHTVKFDGDRPFIDCRGADDDEGVHQHFLDGQEAEDGQLVGLSWPEARS